MKSLTTVASRPFKGFGILRVLVAVCAIASWGQDCGAQAPGKKSSAPQAIKAVRVDLSKTNLEGGPSAPMTLEVTDASFQGRTQPGIQLVMQHRDAGNAVRIPFDPVDRKFGTLQFKMRFDIAEGNPKSFEIWIFNQSGWAATNFMRFAKSLGGGWYQFSWDTVNQPDSHSLDMTPLTEIWLRYNFSAVPEGKTDTLILTDMKFVAGIGVRTGDPERYQQWQKFISNYKPDYSDSSKYLLPPTTGRIVAPLPLTDDGKPFSKIIVPQGASNPLKLAGKELRHWLKQISGADIPIISAPDRGNGTRVFLGRQCAAGHFDKDIVALKGTDGFAVRATGKNIYIFGASDKGTLNGTFAFLENNTDIIWPRPQTELSAVFTTTPTIRAVWANALEIPATRLRGWGTNLGLRPETERWEVRNCQNYPLGGVGVAVLATVRKAQGSYVEFGGGHNISNFLGQDRPERFYPEIDGKKEATFNIWKHQPNFTAPGVVDAVAASALKYLKEVAPPYIDTLNINIEDNWGLSTDKKSLEPIKLPDGTLLKSDDPAFRSTQFFLFLNAVTKKIHAVHPNLMVGTYAYFFVATAPKVAIDPHIRVYFAPYVRKDYRSPLFSPINSHWWEQLTAFAKLTPNLVIREYYAVLNGAHPMAEVVGFDVKSALPLGVKEFTAEMNPDEELMHWGGDVLGERHIWDFLAIDYWVINRIYWNPNQSIEKLRKYYLRRTYHEAAPEMEKFFGILRANWYKERTDIGFYGVGSLIDRYVTQPGDEPQMRQLLARAAAVAKNPVSRMHIDALTKTFNYWVTHNKATPEQKQAMEQRTVAKLLQLGWQNVDLGWTNDDQSEWPSSTIIDRDGKTVPAVRVTVRSKTSGGRDAGIFNMGLAGLPGLRKGDTLAFAMTPTEVPKTAAPLRLALSATDKNGVEIKAPAQAFTTGANGGVQVQWKLTSPDGAFDSTQIAKLSLVVPGDTLGPTPDVTYYITDWSLGHAAEK